MLYWQDKRKEHTLLAIYYLDSTLQKIANLSDCNLEKLRWLGPSELRVDDNGCIDISIVKKRKKGFAFLNSNNEDGVLIGKGWSRIKQLIQNKGKKVSELSGITGSLGRAIGKVKVCMTISHLGKVEKGDILVTSMTRPEFVPVMKKVSGVITDEGGITCHAAIVCRELKIPCLIGTKNATKILKDGMEIELKATHGIVKIIK